MDLLTVTVNIETLVERIRTVCVDTPREDARVIQAIGDAVHAHIYTARILGLEEQIQAVDTALRILREASHSEAVAAIRARFSNVIERAYTDLNYAM